MNTDLPFSLRFYSESDEYRVSFRVMASPCEVIIQTANHSVAHQIAECVYIESKRLEQKYSRYSSDNLIAKIHQHQLVTVDDETARLLNFADQAYQLSEGAFDITSGVLRKIWNFDGSENVPSRAEAKAILPYVGWDKISWDGKSVHVPERMQIDLGGFGKEYAVDSALRLVTSKFNCPVLINLGGDLAANKPPLNREQWSIGVRSATVSNARGSFKFDHGAIATSGDANCYLIHKGQKLSHILNPRTGWPVSQAPSAVSVSMSTCLQAGLLSTLAILQGKDAESFLAVQGVTFWVQR